VQQELDSFAPLAIVPQLNPPVHGMGVDCHIALSIREKSLRQRATAAVRPAWDHAIVRRRRAARHVAAAGRRHGQS